MIQPLQEEPPEGELPRPNLKKLRDVMQGPFGIRSLALTGLFVLAAFYTLYFARATYSYFSDHENRYVTTIPFSEGTVTALNDRTAVPPSTLSHGADQPLRGSPLRTSANRPLKSNPRRVDRKSAPICSSARERIFRASSIFAANSSILATIRRCSAGGASGKRIRDRASKYRRSRTLPAVSNPMASNPMRLRRKR